MDAGPSSVKPCGDPRFYPIDQLSESETQVRAAIAIPLGEEAY
jgi:hypothetical protein